MRKKDSLWVWIETIPQAICIVPYLFLILFDVFKEKLSA